LVHASPEYASACIKLHASPQHVTSNSWYVTSN